MDIWYHGTRRWQDVLNYGLSLDAPRVTDPGDFGWGLYLSKRPVLANVYGRIFKVTLDPSRLAFIENPYFLRDDLKPALPNTPEERLFYSLVFSQEGDMLTVNGAQEVRMATAKAVQRAFLDAGFTGIRTNYGDGETVLFDLSPVLQVDLLPA